MTSPVACAYAKALYRLIPDHDFLVQSLVQINKVFKPDVSQFFEAPQIPYEIKWKMLNQFFNSLPTLLNFLLLLVHLRHLKLLPEIVKCTQKIVTENAGIMAASLITAVPVSSMLINQLQDKLAKRTGKQVALKNKVEPDILGGAILTLGHQRMDGSIKNQLFNLKKELLKVP